MYTVRISWEKQPDEAFVDNKYSRAHTWTLDGGVELSASSSPHVVPLPLSNEAAIDPEEAFIASLSSCHMLWFLSIAAGTDYIVDSYQDNAEGVLAKNEAGKMAMTKVVLKPRIQFGGRQQPSREQVEVLHKIAHEKCYIANSVKTNISIVYG